MYTSDDEVNEFYDNYLSRTKETQKEFSINDATSIGLQPKNKGHCWICPLGCIYVPSQHPNIHKIHGCLEIIANTGFHPTFNKNYLTYRDDDPHNELTWYELSPKKIYALKSAKKIATFEILSTLEVISMNIVPPEVKTFVRLCNPKDHKYDSRTLYKAVDCKPDTRTLDKADSSRLKIKIERLSNKKAREELASLAYISICEPIFTGYSSQFDDPKNTHIHIYKEFKDKEARLLDFRKSCHSSKDCCFARTHPFWLISPNVVFLDGHHRDLEIFCNLQKMIGIVIRHPFFINQCAFKLSPDKLRSAFDTIDKIYELFKLSRNGIPLKFRKFLHQVFTNTPSHQVEDESISKAFQIAFGRRYNEKVCSVPLVVAVREKLNLYQSKYKYKHKHPLYLETDGVGLNEVIFPRPITREQHNVSAIKIQSKWRMFQSKDKAQFLCHQKHVATITTQPTWILFQANVCEHNYERLFQSLKYPNNKKQSIQENKNNNWIPFLDCYQAEIVQKFTSIIILSSPISIDE